MAQAAASATDDNNLFLLSEVRVQDFRLLRDIWLPLRETTVLIGENNTGKTSLLEALAIALSTRPPSEDDLFVDAKGVRTLSFVVDIRLAPWVGTKFDDSPREIFGDAIQGVAEGLEFVAIRCRAEAAPVVGGISIKRRFLQGWARTRAEAESLTEITSLTVSARILSTFAFHLLDAARDISTELRSRRSRWGRLMSDLDIEDSLKDEIETQLGGLSDKIMKSSSLLKAVRTELQQVRNALGSAVEEVEITPIPGRLDEIVGSVDVSVRAPGAAALPMRQQGLGSRNIASLTVFRSFVSLKLNTDAEIRPQAISAFEEPEAHLHPQAQRAAFDLLTTMPGQKLISTHSPYVASVSDVFDLEGLSTNQRRHFSSLHRGAVPVGYRCGRACTSDLSCR